MNEQIVKAVSLPLVAEFLQRPCERAAEIQLRFCDLQR